MTNGDTSNDERYISVQAAQERLRVSARSAQRYAQSGRVRSRRVGNRLQLHEGDVQALAEELGSQNRQVVAQTVPADVLLGYVERLRQETTVLSTRIGQLQEQLTHRPLLEDHTALQQERDSLARRVAEQQAEIQRLQKLLDRPWWRRWFG
ncbi:MAG TPA: helix-turn-helix domain-containing protein [Herpetosiphonaceae bacterium]|nr:helix-turn-helix domain-containing protein [Herpetosiphonaceae bacterium]